jgi:hypothetical protein
VILTLGDAAMAMYRPIWPPKLGIYLNRPKIWFGDR